MKLQGGPNECLHTYHDQRLSQWMFVAEVPPILSKEDTDAHPEYHMVASDSISNSIDSEVEPSKVIDTEVCG